MGLLNEANKSLGITRTETPKPTGGLLKQAKNSLQIQTVTAPQTPNAPIFTKDKGFLSTFATKPTVTPTPQPTFKPTLTAKPESIKYETNKPAGEGLLKFAAKTGVSLADQISEGADFLVDYAAKNLVDTKKPQWPVVSKLNEKWLNFYNEQSAQGNVPTQKLKKLVDTLQQSNFVQDDPDWVALSTKDKLSRKHIGETIINIAPSVLASATTFLVNPIFGAVVSATSTANDVKDEAISYGVDEKKAEQLGLATGILVGALDKIIPSKVLGKEAKSKFVSGIGKRLARLAITSGGEVSTEVLQEQIQILAEKTFREDLGWDEVKTRSVMSGLGGLLGGAGFGLIGNFQNQTVKKDILEGQVVTKPEVKEEVKEKPKTATFNNSEEFAKTIDRGSVGETKSVDELSKTLETKGDEIYRDRVEEYKQKIQNREPIDPIVITPDGEVIDGGHRLTAMKELGIKNAETVIQQPTKTEVVEQKQVKEKQGLTPEVKTKVVEKEVGVAKEQLPVGDGKQRVSRLEARVNKISKQVSNIPQETIDKLSLSTYNQLNKKQNISKAVKYVRKNPNEAIKVLTGEIEPPKGILRNAIYVAMQNEAIGDVELARKIASIGSTRLGQEISILSEVDPNSPVKVMSDVIKIKEEAFNKRYGEKKKSEVKKKTVAEIKKAVKKTSREDWNTFINSIQC